MVHICLLTFTKNSIGQSWVIMYEKILRKEYKERMKMCAIFAIFDLNLCSIYWKTTFWTELRKTKPKNEILLFYGLGVMCRHFPKKNGGGGRGLGSVCLTELLLPFQSFEIWKTVRTWRISCTMNPNTEIETTISFHSIRS